MCALSTPGRTRRGGRRFGLIGFLPEHPYGLARRARKGADWYDGTRPTRSRSGGCHDPSGDVTRQIDVPPCQSSALSTIVELVGSKPSDYNDQATQPSSSNTLDLVRPGP
ncbi:hypothetical protein [Isosphaera pallida]|uniref:hypothetical protein n=1 Tax=Isosphaera pallida TaxID=128 RepID=UPI0011D22A80|nr:hypothetical protein [Isosphaera pallida]